MQTYIFCKYWYKRIKQNITALYILCGKSIYWATCVSGLIWLHSFTNKNYVLLLLDVSNQETIILKWNAACMKVLIIFKKQGS